MLTRALRYLTFLILPIAVACSFCSHGLITFFPLLFVFVVLPLIEFVIGKNASGTEGQHEALVKNDGLFTVVLYTSVLTHLAMWIWFFFEISNGANDTSDKIGKSISMGLMCGVLGINVAHELGHRTSKREQFFARVMLCTSLYMHFFIEHNRGHHRNVGTPDDPASARKNESVYAFWLRTLPGSLFSAWNIVKKERTRRGLPVWSPANEFILYLSIEILLAILIYAVFGMSALVGLLISSLVGILLLETVNYIEHYGLSRIKVSEHRYEDVQPVHSWNSDFVLGRLVLFELTRHSDHHWEPSKHYQLLESMPEASHLPAGYPSMMLLSLLPPFWFRVMNPRIPSH